jgi:hypothetical protein
MNAKITTRFYNPVFALAVLALLATFQSSAWGQTTYTLTVTEVGSGIVTSTDTFSQLPSPVNPNQSQIGCLNGNGACSASYPIGDLVTLYAAAPVGGVFSGWSACNGRLSCTVVMNQDLDVTATFQPCSSSACATAMDGHFYGFGESASSTLLSDGVSSQDSVGADASLSGLLQWGPSIMNIGNSTLTNPTIAISTGLPAASFQGGAIPTGTSAASLPPNGLLGYPFNLSNPVGFTPGFDSSRTVTPLLIQPGTQTQTVTVTVTPKDSRYFNNPNNPTQIGLQFGNAVAPPGPPGNSTPNVQFTSLQSISWTASPPSTGAEQFVNGGPNTWFLNNPVQNTTYTFTLSIQVNNPNSFPVNGKTSIDVNMTVFYPATNGSCGGSVTIPDSLLNGSITYSTDLSPCWAEVTQDSYNVAYWPSLAPESNATSVTSNLNPSTPGDAVTFTATVAPSNGATGTPTGTVTFYDGTTSQWTSTLVGGVATWSTSTLAQGSHSITAAYSGDANFSSSTSPPLTQIVQFPATTTVLSSSLNPSAFGQNVTFTATVSPVPPATGTPCCTVTFMDGANLLGNWNLSQSGQASGSLSNLSVGQHVITATYAGNSNFAGSAASLTQTVNQGQAGISLSASPNPSTYGLPVTFTATVSANGAPVAPSGTVTFSSGGVALGPAVWLGNGQAIFAISTLAVGDYTITAQYSGDSNFAAGSATWMQHVNSALPPTPTIQSVIFDYLNFYATPSFTGNSESLPNDGLMTVPRWWTFNMSNGSTTFSSPTMTINSSLSSQNGNIGAALYTPSSAPGSMSMTAPYTTLSFPYTFTASSSLPPGDGYGYGGAWFPADISGTDHPGFDSTRTVDTLTIPSGGGTQTVTVTVTPVDPRYDPNASDLRSTTINVTIAGNCQTIVGGPPSAQASCMTGGANWTFRGIQGQPNSNPQLNTTYTFAATMQVANPTGAQISSKPQVVVSMLIDRLGGATGPTTSATVTDPALGSAANPTPDSITFSTTGPQATWTWGTTDNSYSVAYASLDATSVTLSSSNPTVTVGQPVTFTAQVANLSNPGGSPLGTLTFYDNGNPVQSSQGWSYATSSLAPGSHTITATYTPTAWSPGAPLGCECAFEGFYGSASAPLAQQVNPKTPTTTTLVSSANPSVFRQPVTFTATVTGSNPTGSVTFSWPGSGCSPNPCTSSVSVNGGGQASFVLQSGSPNPLTPGTYTITAAYSGDGSNASSSGSVSQTVSPANTNTTLTSSANPSTFGQAVTFSARTTGAPPSQSTPSGGTVNFYDGAALIGTVQVSNSQWPAAFTASSLSAGWHNITAQYTDGANFYSSTSAPLTQTVQSTGQTQSMTALVSSANPAVYGQPITFTATVTASGSSGVPTGTVLFNWPGLGSQQVGLNSGSASVTVPVSAGIRPGVYNLTATYSGDATFAGSVGSVTQTVQQATPVIAWNNPAAITYGTPLSGAQLSATAGVPGVFNYTPAAGTVLSAGNQTLSVIFTPTDATDYTTVKANVTILVNPGVATVTLGSLAATYTGSPIPETATTTPTNLTVTFTYNGSSTAPTAAGSYTVVGTVNDPDYTGSASGTLVISKATAMVTLGSLAATYTGNPISATATTTPATLAVTFTYNGRSTAPTAAGSYTVVGTVNDPDYTGSASGTLVISKATPAIAWSTPAAITYGMPLSAAQLNASASTPGSFTYTPGTGTILGAGTQTLSAAFTPTDQTDYTTATATVSIVVLKATPIVIWNNPANIPYGTALGSGQLNATASVAGNFVYTPPAGTVLNPGAGQTLSVTFIPNDSVDYNAVTAAVSINVLSGCVYVLAPSSTSVTMSGNPSVQSACGIYIDSTSSSAMVLSGSPAITVSGGGTTNIVGWYTASGNPVISPAPQKLVTPMADPFAGLAEPTPSGTCQDSGGAVSLSGSTAKTLNPGTYCHAISMSGSSALTLNPGLYLLKGGIAMSGTASITGNQVTLFNYSGAISLSGTGGINITAPSSGSGSAYAGIAIFQSRSDSSAATLSGGAAQKFAGAVYLPDATLTYSGGSSTNAGSITALVVKGITFSGNSHI